MAASSYMVAKAKRMLIDKKISDTELFSSRAFQSWMSVKISWICRAMSTPVPSLRFVKDGRAGFTAYTDGKVITLNVQHESIESQKTRAEKVLIVFGRIVHELMHVLLTDFNTRKCFLEAVSSASIYPNDSEIRKVKKLADNYDDYQKWVATHRLYAGHLQKHLADIDNILEDGFIEDAAYDIANGELIDGLSFKRASEYADFPMASEIISLDDGSAVSAMQNLESFLLCAAKYGRLKYDKPEDLTYPPLAAVMESGQYIDSCIGNKNSSYRRTLAKGMVFMSLWPFYKAAFEENAEKAANSSPNDGMASMTPKGSGIGGSANIPAPQNQSNQGQGNARRMSMSKDKDDGDASNANAEGANDSKSESENETESASGTPNASSAGNRDDASPNDGGGSGSDSGTDEETGGNEASSSASGTDSDKSESSDESNASASNNGADKADETKNEPSDDGKPSDATDGNSNPDTSESQEDSDSNSREGMEVSENFEFQIPQMSLTEIENSLRRIQQELKNELAAKMAVDEQTESLRSDAMELQSCVAHKGLKVRINRHKGDVDETLIKNYDAIAEPYDSIAQDMARRLGFLKRVDPDPISLSGFRSGKKFDVRGVYRGDGRVFTRKTVSIPSNTAAISVLVDGSMSMHGNDKLTIAKAAALTIYLFCQKTGIPCSVFSHSANEECMNMDINVFADFDSPDPLDKMRILEMKPKNANRDGAALTITGKHLLGRPEDTKLLIVISDGLPNACKYTGEAAKADTAAVAKELRRKGIKLFTAAIDGDKQQIESIYTSEGFLDITNLENLPQDMLNLVKRYVKHR